MKKEPKHHARYRRAWNLFRDDSLSKECRKILEQEMDSTQNLFTFQEFQKFKKTLEGFQEYWDKEKMEEKVSALR